MDYIVSFYNNLFAIEIAVFGIIAAVIFVFLQIVYSQFSYREVYGIFKNPFLQAFLTISVITLILTTSGSLFLSFPNINLILVNSVDLNDVFRSWVMAFSLVFTFLLSLALFGIFTLSNISYIRPSRIALLLSKNIKRDQIRDYLLHKYGIQTPDSWLFQTRPIDFIVIRSTVENYSEKNELSEEEQTQKEFQKVQAENKLLKNQKTYDMVKTTVEHAQDPMEALDALMLRAINNVDLATINEIQSVFLHISEDFISNYKNSENQEEWSPYSGLTRKYLEYLVDLFRIHSSMCDRQKLDEVKIKILETSEKIANHVIASEPNGIIVVLLFWKETADSAIGKSRKIFNEVIHLYKNLADNAFQRGIEDNSTVLDEIFRQLGWLGERLISQQGIEEKPLMRDYNYTNEYDELFEVLLNFSHEYNNKYPTSYPLIYFDFVDVIFMQLISVALKTRSQRLKENIFSSLYVYSSFADVAIVKGNNNGAALATIRLKESYDKLLGAGLEESAKQAIGLLVTIGSIAARQKDKLKTVEFIKGGFVDRYIIDIIVTSPFRDKISQTIYEAYIHRDADWAFVIETGKRMKTNFGFMFDWNTGERYPDDDPRRI